MENLYKRYWTPAMKKEYPMDDYLLELMSIAFEALEVKAPDYLAYKNEGQNESDIPVQQGEHGIKNVGTDLPQADSGIPGDKGPEGTTHGADDSQIGQRPGARADTDGSAGKLPNESGKGGVEDISEAPNLEAYQNYRISEKNPIFAKGGEKARYVTNLEALKTLQSILDDGREYATIEEQKTCIIFRMGCFAWCF